MQSNERNELQWNCQIIWLKWTETIQAYDLIFVWVNLFWIQSVGPKKLSFSFWNSEFFKQKEKSQKSKIVIPMFLPILNFDKLTVS